MPRRRLRVGPFRKLYQKSNCQYCCPPSQVTYGWAASPPPHQRQMACVQGVLEYLLSNGCSASRDEAHSVCPPSSGTEGAARAYCVARNGSSGIHFDSFATAHLASVCVLQTSIEQMGWISHPARRVGLPEVVT